MNHNLHTEALEEYQQEIYQFETQLARNGMATPDMRQRLDQSRQRAQPDLRLLRRQRLTQRQAPTAPNNARQTQS